ncbi:MAG: hypothetical protein WBA25_12720 [Jannaschia sp.]
MEAETLLVQGIRASIVLSAVIGLPLIAVADHVPDNLSQDLNPNYIACLAAVDGAEAEFRDALQSTCIQRMGDICSGKNGIAIPSQVIACLHFETQRGIEFVQVAANDLPEVVEQEGFFGRGYQRRRDRILMDAETLQNSPAPDTLETAVQQSIKIASAATTLFWLARETGISTEAHVVASFGGH